MTNIVEFVNHQVSLFNEATSDEKITWAKESQFAIQAFQKNDYLAKTALSNPISAQNAIINIAAIGITLNPASRLAYLVPRDGGVHLDVGYMGLLQLATDTGSILWGQCKLVYEADSYESSGLSKAPIHKYNPFSKKIDRGEIIGAYCTVKTVDGDFLTDEMSIEQVIEIAKKSKSYNASYSPWKSNFDEMVRKTVVRRAYKYWPKSERLDKAMNNSDELDGIELEPVFAHYSDEQSSKEKEVSAIEFKESIDLICKSIESSQTIDELKEKFSDGFIKTRGTDLQQQVQSVYAKRKTELEGK